MVYFNHSKFNREWHSLQCSSVPPFNQCGSDKIELYAGTFDMLCTNIKCNNVQSWNYQQEISPQRSHVLRSYNDYDDMIFLIPEF